MVQPHRLRARRRDADERERAPQSAVQPSPATHASEPRIQRLVDLQRVAGNAAVATILGGAPLVQRKVADTHVLQAADEGDVPTEEEATALKSEWVDLDAKQKAATKDEPFAATDAARLAEVNRLIGLRFKKDVALTLSGNSVKGGPAAWFAQVSGHTFLGSTITVHDLLWAKLEAVEKEFLDKVPGATIRSTSSLRGPTEGLHGLGLAIDLNPGTNPYIINPSSSSQTNTGEPLKRSKAVRAVIDRAVLLVLGRTATEEDFGSQPKNPDRAGRIEESFDKLTEASGAMKRYFELGTTANRQELEELATALRDKNPKAPAVADWLAAIRADRATLDAASVPKKWTDPQKGFFDLDRRLVQALTGQGLSWLGDITVGSGRDIMHFDMRGLGPIHRIFKEGAWKGLGGD